jgi:hypothetical protein
MAIPNVNEITSTLRMMSDQQLQQYASMHKADPYILPMAISESNARKQMRASQQAQAGGQQQPKVADADIAAINPPPPQMAPQGMPPQGGPQMVQRQLPEQQGIGALPTPNMQRMADGGIAGYADGGEFNYAGGSAGPLLNMAEGGIARFAGDGESLVRTTSGGKDWFLDVPDTVQDPNVAWYRTMPNPLAGLAGKKFASKEEAIAAYDRANAVPTREHTPASQMAYNPPTTAAMPDIGIKPPLAPPTTRPTTRQSGAAPSAPAVKAPSYMSQFETIANKNSPPEAQGIAALMAERKQAREEAGVTGEAGEAQKQALEKEGMQAADDKKEMLWMSLIKGGLAAAGGTSQYAIKNIADGFGVGLDDAAKGMKELKLAEKERNRGLAAIEEARRAEKRGDVDTAITAKEKATDRMANYNMHLMSSQATLLGNQISADASIKGHEISAAATRAAAGASQRAQIDMINMYGNDPKFAANFDKYTAAKREPMSIEKMRVVWDDPMKRMLYQQQHPNVKTFDDYLTMESGVGANNSGFKVVGVR